MARTTLLIALASGLALAACAKDKEAAAPPNSGLTALAPEAPQSSPGETGQDLASMARQAAADIASLRAATSEPATTDLAAASQPLDIAPSGGASPEQPAFKPFSLKDATETQALQAAATEPGVAIEASSSTSPPAAPDMAASDLAWQQTAADQAWQNAAGTNDAAPQAGATAVSASADTRTIELSGVLARVLRQMDMEQMDPQVQAVFLAPIEQISPGFLGSLADPNSSLRQALSEEDVDTLLSAREHAQAAPSPQASAGADPVFAVPNVQLCTRVRGFGQYEPCAGESFPAGRPARVLVYSEVDGFKNRDADNSMKAVELTQRLSLFSDATGEAVWSTSEARVVETAHRIRRDFYLVQQVELPANLAIGSYTLKVMVSDAVGNAQAERTIPVKFHASVGEVSGQ